MRGATSRYGQLLALVDLRFGHLSFTHFGAKLFDMKLRLVIHQSDSLVQRWCRVGKLTDAYSPSFNRPKTFTHDNVQLKIICGNS